MNLNEPAEAFELSINPDVKLQAAYPTLKNIVRLFFVFLFYSIIFGVAMAGIAIFCDTYNIKSSFLKPLLSLLTSIISMLVIIKYARKKADKNEDVPLKIKISKVPLWLFPVLILSTLALIVGLERISDLIPMPVSVDKFFRKMFTTNIFSLVSLVIVAPVLEEILCRGIVLRGLLKNYAPHYAILISATFFAILHLNPWQAIPAFFGGSFIGWVYYKTQSVIPGMVIHATINCSAAILLFFPKYQKDPIILLGVPYYSLLCMISGIVLLASCIIIQKRISNVPE